MLCLALSLWSLLEEPRPQRPAVAECFVLESPERACLGWARFLEREIGGGRALEVEWIFLRPGDSPWQVRHVEELSPRAPRLVWREHSGLSGRTLLLDRPSGSGDWTLESMDREGRDRRQLSTAGGAQFPLALLDLCRRGELAAAHVRVFEPLEAALAQRTVSTRLGLAQPDKRVVVWQRPDGTPSAHWCFEGRSLSAFRLGPGLSARRMAAEEWRQATQAALTPPVDASGR